MNQLYLNYRQILNTFFFLSAFFYANTMSAQNQTREAKVKVEEFEQKIKSSDDPQIVDVRTPEEYKKGHVKDALNVDWNSEEFDNMVKALDKNQPVYVYCLSGGRSAKAAERLKETGFTEIYELEGGMMAWNNAEKPTVQLAKSDQPEMTMEDYKKAIDSDRLVLVDFNAPWCAPCKKMAPMLEELSKSEKDKVKIVQINIEDHKSLAKELNVQILPTLVLYKDDKAVWKHEGYMGKEQLLEVINKN